MIQNTILIIAIIAVCIGIVAYYIRALKTDETDIDYESVYAIDYLTKAVAKEFADYQRSNLKEQNLTRKELQAARRKKQELRRSLKTSGFGDTTAKKFVLSFIENIITSPKYNVTEETVDNVFPFHKPNILDTRTKTEVIYWLYFKHYGNNGFSQLMTDYELYKPKQLTPAEEEQGALPYEINAADIDRIFPDVLKRFRLSSEDKLHLVCSRIFANYIGLSVIDPLFDFALDEIDGGVSGVPQGIYDLKPEMMSDDFEYSFQSLFITYKGINYKMSCMSFGSQEELIRVCQNIYKFSAPYALSKNRGYVVGTMKSGARIAVARPDVSGSWCFFVRKFDSAAALAPEKLITDKKAIIPITVLKWIIRCQQSVGITGEMSAGKSTMIKSLIRFTPSSKSIRVFEISPELNLQFTYPKRNIVNFSATESISMQELYDFGKKTNSNINIIGESASAEQGVIVIQSATVGSEQAIFTHHGKTLRDLVLSLRDNLISAGGYSDEKVAESVVANCIHFNLHLGRTKGHRYIERITEVIPISDRRYPSEKDASYETAGTEDTLEFYKRQTDREIFTEHDIVRFDKSTQEYRWVNDFTPEKFQSMCNKLDSEEEAAMLKDMDILKKIG